MNDGPDVGKADGGIGANGMVDVGAEVGGPAVVVTAATIRAFVTVPTCSFPGTAVPATANPLVEISISLREEEVKTVVGTRH